MEPVCPCDDCKKAMTPCCHKAECDLYRTYQAQMYIWKELTKEFHLRLRRHENMK